MWKGWDVIRSSSGISSLKEHSGSDLLRFVRPSHFAESSPFAVRHLRNFFPSMWEKSATIGKYFAFFSGLDWQKWNFDSNIKIPFAHLTNGNYKIKYNLIIRVSECWSNLSGGLSDYCNLLQPQIISFRKIFFSHDFNLFRLFPQVRPF
jgi:hypothetical protein